MANSIRIKRRTLANGTGTPSGLAQGELAYSEHDQKLFIGIESAAQHIIGGKGSFVTWPGTGIIVQTAAASGATPPTVAARTITGTTNQIAVSNGDGVSGNPTLSIVSNPIMPGTGGMQLPEGDTSQRPATPGSANYLRYNTDDNIIEWWNGSTWVQPGTSGVVSFTTVAADSGTNAVADSSSDTLTIAGGTGINTVAANDPETITINLDINELSTVSSTGSDLVVFADVSDSNTPKKETKDNFLSAYAPLASPALTGTPTAPTAGAGTNTTQIATTAFVTAAVQAAQQGLDVKESVRVATTANITLSGTQTIDGVSVSAGNRVLVKNQSTGAENGIYACAAGAWSRTADADASAEVTAGMFVFVAEGTVNADSGWILTTDDAITLGTTALTFTQFSGAGQITAGAALTKTGNTLDVAVDGTTIEVNSDALRVKAGSNGQALVTAGGVATWGQVSLTAGVTGTLPVANGGTNLTSLGTGGQFLKVNSGATALEYSDVVDGGTF